MSHRFADIAFTASVRAQQSRMGTASRNERLQSEGEPHDRLGADEAEFIGARDSFYMASVSDTGWPYVQHRGGPKGFLHVLDDRTLAFADFRGNGQYMSTGNLHHDDRLSLILVDHAARRRLKILGRGRMIEASADPHMVASLESPNYRARPERAVIITVAAFDWNCPQHITPRFTLEEMATRQAPDGDASRGGLAQGPFLS